VQRAYLRYCRELARAGLVRAPGEGPVTFAKRAATRLPSQGAAIDAITSHYIAARYGSASKAALAPLRRAVREFRALP
jgi:hypothetical protein